jgi:hypothetical protein
VVPLLSDKAMEDPYAMEFGSSIAVAIPRVTPRGKWQSQRNIDFETAQKLNDSLLGASDEALLSPEGLD